MTTYNASITETLTVKEVDSKGTLPHISETIDTEFGLGLVESIVGLLPHITETLTAIESITPVSRSLSETITIIESIVRSIYSTELDDHIVATESFLVDTSSSFSDSITLNVDLISDMTVSFAGSFGTKANSQILTVIEGFTGYTWRVNQIFPRSLEDRYVG